MKSHGGAMKDKGERDTKTSFAPAGGIASTLPKSLLLGLAAVLVALLVERLGCNVCSTQDRMVLSKPVASDEIERTVKVMVADKLPARRIA